MDSLVSNPITLDQIRALIEGDPPVGAEVAHVCGYDALELARLCRRSPRQLRRVFGEAGRTPRKWLLEHRILRALAILEQLHTKRDLISIKWLSIEFGYRHSANFCRDFKKVIGFAPTEFLAERKKSLHSVGLSPENCLINGTFPAA